MNSARRWRLALFGGAVLVIVLTVTLALLKSRSSAAAPSATLLYPLPPNTNVVFNRTFPGGGSSEAARRLVILKADEVDGSLVARMNESLGNRGWNVTTSDSAISPNGTVCVGLDPASAYINDPVRSAAAREQVRQVTNGEVAYLVVSMLKC